MSERIGRRDAGDRPPPLHPFPPLADVLAKIRALGVTLPPGRVRLDAYGDSPELSESLLAQIRAGTKRAGTALLWALEAEGESLPAAGDIDLVLDHRGEPALVTRTTRVDVVRFCDVDAEYAAVEGEGDGSLGFWRRGHWGYFVRECARIGRVPSEAMPVVCSRIEVVCVLPPPDDGATRDEPR